MRFELDPEGLGRNLPPVHREPQALRVARPLHAEEDCLLRRVLDGDQCPPNIQEQSDALAPVKILATVDSIVQPRAREVDWERS